MRRLLASAVLCIGSFATDLLAQNYNQFVAFGDSTTDTGWFANAKLAPGIPNPFDIAVANAVAAGGNAHFTGPGPGNAQILAAHFGLTANPANVPGGTNYAIGGAFSSGGPGIYSAYTNFQLLAPLAFGLPPFPLNPAIPSTAGQIGDYLASVHGQANPSALYLISSGGNDGLASALLHLTPLQAVNYFKLDTALLAQSIAGLQAAGARYIMVANEYGAPPGGKPLADTIWFDLAALGVKFIPADTQAVIAAVAANPTEFGITAPISSHACTPPAGYPPIFATGPICVATTVPSSTYATLVSADALQTHLFVDPAHLSEAGQQIIADYYYSLLTAPSEISFLAENAVKTRLSLVSSIQNQIDASESHRGPNGINAWVSGDAISISMDNYRGFPGDPGTYWSGAAGVDMAIAPGVIGGIAVSAGTIDATLGSYGSFRQSGSTVSLYAAYGKGPLWGNAIGTYGHLDYNINRVVPIGISFQANSGSTAGEDWSAAFQGGYRLYNGGLTHGPVFGFVYQNVQVKGFTESGSFTSLGFGSQSRESDIGQFGYKASMDLPGIGPFMQISPFAQITWNREFADTNRLVTASLTTAIAPSYSLPAVILGKDWGEVKGGAKLDLGGGATFLAVGSADFGQGSAAVYGVSAGLNLAF